MPGKKRITYNFATGSEIKMKDWKTPEFVELRCDAEINCYSSALPESGKVRIPNRQLIEAAPEQPES